MAAQNEPGEREFQEFETRNPTEQDANIINVTFECVITWPAWSLN
jgi:hypothetical protein